jgi:nitroreductase
MPSCPTALQSGLTWREYHDATKHSPQSLRRSPHFLDWANMPDPFRHYEDVPVLDLPADPPSPGIPALRLLLDPSARGAGAATDGPTFLSQLLFYSAAISASKRVPSTGYQYALRVNPSSGNLHPTEFHFLARDLVRWPAGLYHYRPSSHMAEQRALLADSAPLVFILTSIAWREAWKYRDRAYRYCLLDIGHAWQSLALAARAIGCESHAEGRFPDDETAESLRLNGDEWPMLVVSIRGSIPMGNAATRENMWFNGRANQLSESRIPYPLIDQIHRATKLPKDSTAQPAPAGSGDIKLPPPASSDLSFGDVARTRRSALDFTGDGSMPLGQLAAILHAAEQPLAADFSATRFVQLYLYAHRVDGLPPASIVIGPMDWR